MENFKEIHSYNGNTNLSFFVKTFGCQQNKSGTERVADFLINYGFVLTKNIKEASFIIVNTCAVRHSAEDRIFGYLGELKRIKKNNPNVFILVFGCMTQQSHIKNKIKEAYSFVDLTLGTDFKDFVDLFYEKIISKNKSKKNYISNYSHKFKALVPIISGCNNFCSYCVVPFVRGREKSRNISEILKEVNILINNGCKDITLLGQNVNSYGNDLGVSDGFSDLIKKIDNIKGNYRLRFMTSHPKDFTNKLIDTIKNSEHFSNHVHLPFQSGSNKILDLMNRKYTKEKYLNTIEYLKFSIPNVFITSDVIIGFPKENKEDFNQTLSLIEKVKFISIFTFIYSPRNGTSAFNLDDNLPKTEKIERMNILLDVQKKITNSLIKKNILNKIFRVLIESDNNDFFKGRMDNNLTVKIYNSEKLKKGSFYNVKINEIIGNSLFGKVIDS